MRAVAGLVFGAGIFCVSARAQDAAKLQDALPYLTNAAQVRAMSPEQAARQHPVRLTGVVLYYDQKSFRDLVVQDGTASIYVDSKAEHQFVVRPGQRVELTGVSAAGEFAPMVIPSALQVLGDGKIAAARPVAYAELATGVEDGQWVEVRGIVRSTRIERLHGHPDHSCLIVNLAMSGGSLAARVLDFRPEDRDALVDSEVRVRGVCIPIFNARGQLFNVSLMVTGMEHVAIESAASAAPFEASAHPISSLMRFSPERRPGHRLKVKGQVTFQKPGEFLFIQDGSQGLRVQTKQAQRFSLGEMVEVLGFAGLGEYSPVLEDAIVREVGPASPLLPQLLAVEQARFGGHDGDLIQVDAELVELVHGLKESVLVFRDENLFFNASLLRSRQESDLKFPPLGSRVRLTGICQVHLEGHRRPHSFRLLLRSPADLLLLQPPPWWISRQTLWLLVVAAGLSALVLIGMLMVFKRRLRDQAQARRDAEVEFAAVNQERNRLAGELHDTLEQGLTGVLLQAEAAAETFSVAPEAARRHLELVRKLVHQSQDEARRSVRGLRSQMLDNNDLPSALSALGRQVADGGHVRVTVETLGTPCRLPEQIESHLLRVGQEAVTNAVKHARPQTIQVELAFQPGTVALSVSDNGQGFDPNSSTGAPSDRFGLVGMRERAKKVGGKLMIESAQGKGTTVTLEVPLP